MHKGWGAFSNSAVGSKQHGSCGHVAFGEYSSGDEIFGDSSSESSVPYADSAGGCVSCSLDSGANPAFLPGTARFELSMRLSGAPSSGALWFGPVPASCTNSGALPMVMAAVGSVTSCVKLEDSSWHGIFVDAAAADSAAAAASNVASDDAFGVPSVRGLSDAVECICCGEGVPRALWCGHSAGILPSALNLVL